MKNLPPLLYVAVLGLLCVGCKERTPVVCPPHPKFESITRGGDSYLAKATDGTFWLNNGWSYCWTRFDR